APQHVGEHVGAELCDRARLLHRRPAVIKPNASALDGTELFETTPKGVAESESHVVVAPMVPRSIDPIGTYARVPYHAAIAVSVEEARGRPRDRAPPHHSNAEMRLGAIPRTMTMAAAIALVTGTSSPRASARAPLETGSIASVRAIRASAATASNAHKSPPRIARSQSPFSTVTRSASQRAQNPSVPGAP